MVIKIYERNPMFQIITKLRNVSNFSSMDIVLTEYAVNLCIESTNLFTNEIGVALIVIAMKPVKFIQPILTIHIKN